MKTATILAITTLALPAAAWVHVHGSELAKANEIAVAATARITASSLRTNRDIRDLGNEVSDLKMKIERKHSALIQIHLSSNKDPRILELKNQIERGIRDDERELEQKQRLLRGKEIIESALIERLPTA